MVSSFTAYTLIELWKWQLMLRQKCEIFTIDMREVAFLEHFLALVAGRFAVCVSTVNERSWPVEWLSHKIIKAY